MYFIDGRKALRVLRKGKPCTLTSIRSRCIISSELDVRFLWFLKEPASFKPFGKRSKAKNFYKFKAIYLKKINSKSSNKHWGAWEHIRSHTGSSVAKMSNIQRKQKQNEISKILFDHFHEVFPVKWLLGEQKQTIYSAKTTDDYKVGVQCMRRHNHRPEWVFLRVFVWVLVRNL